MTVDTAISRNRWRFIAILLCGGLALSIGLVTIHNRNRNRATSPREQGTVKWFNASKGYGFIQRHSGEAGEEVFFSASQVEGGKSLKEGQTVEFEIVRGPKGLQAENIKIPAPK